jgi:hypothetical protein
MFDPELHAAFFALFRLIELLQLRVSLQAKRASVHRPVREYPPTLEADILSFPIPSTRHHRDAQFYTLRHVTRLPTGGWTRFLRTTRILTGWCDLSERSKPSLPGPEYGRGVGMGIGTEFSEGEMPARLALQ